MSCPNATSPVDIINNNSSICDLKCNYNFNYPLTNLLTISNRGEYLSIRTEKSQITPVKFNADNYEVRDIRIYKPSLHTYGGSTADAEMIISHTNLSGGNNLLVCIPITIGSSSNESTSFLDTILSDVAKNSNSTGNYTITNIATFTLNKFVPMKPYYSYNGSLPYSPCNGSYNYVVFSKEDSAIYMSSSAFDVLDKTIYTNKYSTKKNKGGLFYNKTGPTTISSDKGDDVYIECVPTGSSGETLVPLVKTSEALFNIQTLKDIYNSIIFRIFIGIVVLLAITKIGSIILDKISGQKGGEIIQAGGLKSHKKLIISSQRSLASHFIGYAGGKK
jgi:carbonic anhydrase